MHGGRLMEKSKFISDLLLRYSFPCGRILKSEDVLNEQDYDLLTRAVRGEEKFPLHKFEEYFIVVSDGVNVHGTDDEIRSYFWFHHNSNIRPIHCLAMPGLIKESSGKMIVENLYTGKGVEATLLLDVKEGDYVVIHLNHIVDKITKNDANKILNHLNGLEFDEVSKRLDKILPAKIKSISRAENKATVDDGDVDRKVNIKLVKDDAKVGDYVLVHYTHAFKIITEEEAKMLK
jgi:hydrogenase assembly chaperone HypC/HupF